MSDYMHPLSHVADCRKCYPGETVTFSTLVITPSRLDGFRVTVTLQTGLVYTGYGAPESIAGVSPEITVGDDNRSVIWTVKGPLPAGTKLEFQVRAVVSPVTKNEDATVICQAELDVTPASQGSAERTQSSACFFESATVRVLAKTAYLGHLPALYEDDDLMGRFLRVFESFWAPLEQQITDLPYYFDPATAPPGFLPWLASWVGLTVDGYLPEFTQRRLVCACGHSIGDATRIADDS